MSNFLGLFLGDTLILPPRFVNGLLRHHYHSRDDVFISITSFHLRKVFILGGLGTWKKPQIFPLDVYLSLTTNITMLNPYI